jgi:hypothetical protein
MSFGRQLRRSKPLMSLTLRMGSRGGTQTYQNATTHANYGRQTIPKRVQERYLPPAVWPKWPAVPEPEQIR